MSLKKLGMGLLGGSVCWANYFSSGHDLVGHGFEPYIGLDADSSEPGACFRCCVSLPLCPFPARPLSPSLPLSLSKKIVFFLKARDNSQIYINSRSTATVFKHCKSYSHKDIVVVDSL